MKVAKKDLIHVEESIKPKNKDKKKSKPKGKKKQLDPHRFEPKYLNVTLRELFEYQKEEKQKHEKGNN